MALQNVAFTNAEKTLFILDVELNRSTKSYPQQTDESFGKSIQMYYTLMSRKPKVTEFDVSNTDKSSTGIYSAGPFYVRGPSKQVVKDHAIASFLNERVKIKPEKPIVERLWKNCIGEKHFCFVNWKLAKEETFAQLRKRFHERTHSLYLSDFIFVCERREFDAAVCEHKFYGVETPEVRQHELKRHIEVCLSQRVEGTNRPNGPDVNHKKWSEIPVQFNRSQIPVEAWVQEHPYFSKNCKYIGPGQVLLTEEEQQRLQPECFQIYMQLANGTQIQDLDYFTKKLREIVNTLMLEYKNNGYDNVWFAMHHQWTALECLKCIASPPPTRSITSPMCPTCPPAVLSSLSKTEFHQSHQDFAMKLSRLISIWTNDKNLGVVVVTGENHSDSDSSSLYPENRKMGDINTSGNENGSGKRGRGGGAGTGRGRGRGKTSVTSRKTTTILRGKKATGRSAFDVNLAANGSNNNNSNGAQVNNNKLTQSLLGENKYIILAVDLQDQAVEKFCKQYFPTLEIVQCEGKFFGIKIGIEEIHKFVTAIAALCFVPIEKVLSDIDPKFDEGCVLKLLPTSIKQQNIANQQIILAQQTLAVTSTNNNNNNNNNTSYSAAPHSLSLVPSTNSSSSSPFSSFSSSSSFSTSPSSTTASSFSCQSLPSNNNPTSSFSSAPSSHSLSSNSQPFPLFKQYQQQYNATFNSMNNTSPLQTQSSQLSHQTPQQQQQQQQQHPPKQSSIVLVSGNPLHHTHKTNFVEMQNEI